jgi:hypothetical protein
LNNSIQAVPTIPSEAERVAIYAELERLLTSPRFSHSRRFPSFLRFVVQETLEGRAELLKERVLGIEVFGKSADYDTNADPIVRVTAAEVRKRLAQYYQETVTEGELQIALPSGSYVPHFIWNAFDKAALEVPTAEPPPLTLKTLPPVTIPVEPAPPTSSSITLSYRTLAIIAGVILLAAGAFVIATQWKTVAMRDFDEFWAPFFKSRSPVLICVADQSHTAAISLRDAADPAHQTLLPDTAVTVVIDDVMPLTNIVGLLRTRGRDYRVQGEAATSLADLREGPAVLIGAFDNSWTLRMTSDFRYHFANNADWTRFWIVDQTNPTAQTWAIDRAKQQATNTYEDYAIVARFLDPNTNQFTIVAAGVGRGGTIAAGEFLKDPAAIEQVYRKAPKNWGRKNLELILKTEVIEGTSGQLQIVATHFW